jgi:hypothetical protein
MSHQFTSHSRLGVFESCQQKYYREYILKERIKQEADHFIIGTMCHSAIEDTWNGDQPSVRAALDHNWQTWLEEKSLGYLKRELANVAKDIGSLWKRASADYTGKDAIRKAGNLVADNPTMTKAWKDAAAELKIAERQISIDIKSRSQLGTAYVNVSLVNCYAETYAIMENFKDPDCLASVEYLEFPLSEQVYGPDPEREGKQKLIEIINPVKFSKTNTYLNGYIDVVGKNHKGEVVILDHKTSSGAAPIETAVAHNEQLLQYAWAWHQLTGEWPGYVGINHLRSGTCVTAPVNPERVLSVIERREHLILATSQGIYPKKDPFAYSSPCLKIKDGSLSDYCPHLSKCHPEVAKDLGLKVDL